MVSGQIYNDNLQEKYDCLMERLKENKFKLQFSVVDDMDIRELVLMAYWQGQEEMEEHAKSWAWKVQMGY